MPELWKRCQSLKSETLSLKTTINKFDFLRKIAIIQKNRMNEFAVACKKVIEKIPDSCNAKEHYQLFIKYKNTKSVKQSEIITYWPKTFENPNQGTCVCKYL